MVKNSFILDFNKLPKAFLIALLIIFICYIIELLLPINFFTFRVWEALNVRGLRFALPGPFYPNMKISMITEGDLGHHTKFAIKKKVEWETDQYGYRKRNENISCYKIVIIGDSFTAGCNLTQQYMLSEMLEGILKTSIYPLAPADINIFLKDERFIKNPPEVVILECIEREILRLPKLTIYKEADRSSCFKKYLKGLLKNIQPLTINLDRIYKNIMFFFFSSRINQIKDDIVDKIIFFTFGSVESQNMLFYQGPEANADVSQEELNRISIVIKEYNEILKSRGIWFIFLPMPNKENVYFELLSIKKRPIFLDRLIAKLKNDGIEVIDMQKTFEKARIENILLYDVDDSHWNVKGVELTANSIEKFLNNIK